MVKLALYAQGGRNLSHDDIEAIVGDAAETALENFVYAASGGDAKPRCRSFSAWRPADRQGGGAVALGRHFTQLHRVAAAIRAAAVSSRA